MLVAEKQLLDANLRNDLQMLRRLEIKMLVSRYQTAIPAATLIVGFTFTSVVELEFLEYHHPSHAQVICERIFYVCCSIALSGSMYAMAVSSIAIMLGQRLAVQATATLTAKHEYNVKELSRKFIGVLASLLVSLSGVVGAAICAIWVKAREDISIVSTCMICALLPFTVWSIVSLNMRLNDNMDEPGSLSLVAAGKVQHVGEFRVGDKSSIPADVEHAYAKHPLPTPQQAKSCTEQSALLKCAFPAGKS